MFYWWSWTHEWIEEQSCQLITTWWWDGSSSSFLRKPGHIESEWTMFCTFTVEAPARSYGWELPVMGWSLNRWWITKMKGVVKLKELLWLSCGIPKETDSTGPSRVWLWKKLKQNLWCSSLVNPWNKTFDLPQRDSGKLPSDSGGQSGAVLIWCIVWVGCSWLELRKQEIDNLKDFLNPTDMLSVHEVESGN